MAVNTSVILTTYNYVDGAMANFHDPNYHKALISIYPGQVGDNMTEFYRSIGYTAESPTRTFNWYEDRFVDWKLTHRNAIEPATAPGAAITFTLNAVSHNNSGTSSPVQVNDVLLFKNDTRGRVTATNKTVANAHTVTVVPLLTTDNIGPIAANDEIICLTNMWDEAQGQPDGLTPLFDEYANDVQTFKGTYDISYEEYNTKSRITMLEGNAAGINPGSDYIFVRGCDDEYMRLKNRIDGAVILGARTNNQTAMPDNAVTTQGVIPAVQAGGIVRTYTPGNLTIQWWDQLQNQIVRNFGAKNYHCWAGLLLRQEITNTFATDFNNGALVFGSFISGNNNPTTNQEIALNYGFSGFAKDGIAYNFKTYDAFNHPQRLGATGFTYNQSMLMIPNDTVRDPKTRNQTPGIVLKHLRNMMMTQHFGGKHAPTGPTNDNSSIEVWWEATCGAMTPARNRYVWVTPN